MQECYVSVSDSPDSSTSVIQVLIYVAFNVNGNCSRFIVSGHLSYLSYSREIFLRNRKSPETFPVSLIFTLIRNISILLTTFVALADLYSISICSIYSSMSWRKNIYIQVRHCGRNTERKQKKHMCKCIFAAFIVTSCFTND